MQAMLARNLFPWRISVYAVVSGETESALQKEEE